MASPWNHWQIPAPMMIMVRPCDSSELSAISLAIRTTCSAGTEVIDSCQPGVYGSAGSS